MNKRFAYIALAGLLTAFSSCDDFLDVSPNSGFSEGYVYNSATEMRSAVNGIYSLMTESNAYGRNIESTFSPNTDVEMSAVSTNVPTVDGRDITCYEPNSTWSSLNGTWNAMYEIINFANDVIQGIEGSELYDAENPGANAEVAQLYGEAKCLRAMTYLDLIRIWGDVVFRTEPADASSELEVGTTDRNEILSYLIDELRAVEPYMMYASEMEEGVERASREYCQGLIGLLAMNRGGWTLRPDTDNPQSIGSMQRADDYMTYYDIAIDYLGRVINEGHHNLNLSFEQLWYSECNWNTPDDDDIIFSIPMLTGTSSVFGSRIGVAIEEGSEYGSASNNYPLNPMYFYTFDRDDLRRDQTVSFVSYDGNLNQVLVRFDRVANFAVAKWNKLKMATPLGSGSFDNTGINYTYMRYADVLLLYAEALNERNNGPTEEARNALKQVRRRAFDSVNWPQKVEAYVDNLGTYDDFFQAIMDERKWEFGGEGIRKYDLARWNRVGEVIYEQYHLLQAWADAAWGISNPNWDGPVPEYCYYREVADPDHADRTMLDLYLFNEDGEIATGRPDGYLEEPFAYSWREMNNETQTEEYIGEVQWSFRGFINPNNEGSVRPTDPLRYLCPYPSQVITDHRGAIQNYYGY